MEVVVLVYKVTATFPKEETYGLVSQMRRAAISIPCNIAEGRKRSSENEFRHFLKIAFGSAAELETQIEISIRLGYVTAEQVQELNDLLNEVLRMLNKLSSIV